MAARYPHEQAPAASIGELDAVQDVAALSREKSGNRMDDSRPIGTGELQDEVRT